MAGNVVSSYGPPNSWWTLEEELALDPGNWVEVSNQRFYSQADAEAYAMDRARDNFINVRVIHHGA
jgi:hypothetical protein